MWDRQAWREATWLGHPVMRYPTDLHTYQELIAAVRPATILIVGDDAGLAGRARFAASVCDLLDHGRVIALGGGSNDGGTPHPRITWIDARAESEEAAAQVLETAGPDPQALVILGLGDVMRIVASFEHYAPLVPVGGYVVIENTVVNGRPVASGFGPGPHEATINILGRRHEFVADPTLERYTLTFNRNGYLRRMAPS
jgi:cephalosporin hydroxylase